MLDVDHPPFTRIDSLIFPVLVRTENVKYFLDTHQNTTTRQQILAKPFHTLDLLDAVQRSMNT